MFDFKVFRFSFDFAVKIGACSAKRTITSKAAIYKALGNDQFVELASFSLLDLDKYLTPVELDEAVGSDLTGARKTTVTKIDS